MQKKTNEIDGDVYFLNKYDEAQAALKQLQVEGLPTVIIKLFVLLRKIYIYFPRLILVSKLCWCIIYYIIG